MCKTKTKTKTNPILALVLHLPVTVFKNQISSIFGFLLATKCVSGLPSFSLNCISVFDHLGVSSSVLLPLVPSTGISFMLLS